ncbi:MAG: hypothetical protein KGI71_05070 [Patescibacteria group bacterium]|nr:hypothetical protein [Patescibacteria group bacterium]
MNVYRPISMNDAIYASHKARALSGLGMLPFGAIDRGGIDTSGGDGSTPSTGIAPGVKAAIWAHQAVARAASGGPLPIGVAAQIQAATTGINMDAPDAYPPGTSSSSSADTGVQSSGIPTWLWLVGGAVLVGGALWYVWKA